MSPTTEPARPDQQHVPLQNPRNPPGQDTPDPSDPDQSIGPVLSRPIEQRVREYKYRFAQSVVFGLPVLGLQYFGLSLGGPEAGKWVGLFQALLAGWVMYVGAAGMLFEGILILRQRLTLDLVFAILAIGLYLASVPSVVHALAYGQPRYAVWFHASVVVIMLWTGIQWMRHSNRR